MKRTITVGALALLLVGCGGSGSDPAADKAAEKAAVDEIQMRISDYLTALDNADAELAGKVWVNSPEVSAITPIGHPHGWEEIKAMYGFFGTTFTDRKLTAHEIAIHVFKDSARAEFDWHYTAKMKANGMPFESDGRESQFYNKIDGHWKLVHIHYSGPAMTPPQ